MNGAIAAVDNDLVGDAVKIASGAGGLGGGLIFARWAINWITGRHDRKEAALEAKDNAIDERWAKYTKRMEDRCELLEGRCERLEGEVEECHRSKRELESRVAKLEGFSHGIGDRRQDDQISQSYDRTIADRLGKGKS